MADQSTNPPSRPKAVHSMEELAQIMAQNREQMRARKDPLAAPNPDAANDPASAPASASTSTTQPNEVTDDAENDSNRTDAVEEEGGNGQNEGTNDLDEPDEDEGSEREDHDDGDEDDEEPAGPDEEGREETEDLVLNDDDLIELEGLDEPITLKELKDVYKADEVLVQRVAETNANYDKASQTYAKAATDSENLVSSMRHTLEKIDQLINVPIISEPPADLKQSDPTRYIQHLEAYQQDQNRIKETREAVLDTLNGFDQQRKETLKTRRQHELARLAEKLPTLRNESTRVKNLQDIAAAAAHYGFTPEELESAADHRLLLMAYEAQQYRKIKGNGSTSSAQEEREQKLKRVIKSGTRPMRSGNTAAPDQNRSVKRRIKVAENKARETGNPSDVANYMAQRRQLKNSN